MLRCKPAWLLPRGTHPSLQVRTDLFPHRLSDVAVTAFFGDSMALAEPPVAAVAATGSGNAAGGSAAAQVLLQHAARQAAATAAAATPLWQPQLQQHGRSLFEAVEAAGAGGSVLESSNELTASSVTVAGAWAVAVALSWWLLHGT